MRIIRKTQVFISSDDRQSGNSNDFTVNLPRNFIRKTSPDELVRFYIQTAVIKNDFDKVNSLNSAFRVGGTTYTLPMGNPNANDMAAFLSSIPGFGTVTFNKVNNKYSFRPTSTLTLNFDIENSAHKILGFAKQSYIFPAGTSVMSPQETSIGTPLLLLINSNQSSTNYRVKADDTVRISNTLVAIPIAVSPFANIIYTDPEGINCGFSILRDGVSSIKFWVLDQDEKAIELKSDWFIVLAIEFIKLETMQLINSTKAINDTLTESLELTKLQMVAKDMRRPPPDPSLTRNARAPEATTDARRDPSMTEPPTE